MCRQAFATEGSQRTPVRFISPSTVADRNRPNPARLSHILFSFHFEFSDSPVAPENRQWYRAVPGRGQQSILVEPCCGLVSKRAGSGAVLPEARSFHDKSNAVGAPFAERGRSVQTCRTSAEFAAENAETSARNRSSRSDEDCIRAIATACRRTPVRWLFRRSRACMWRR
jgi:hypothetical protein